MAANQVNQDMTILPVTLFSSNVGRRTAHCGPAPEPHKRGQALQVGERKIVYHVFVRLSCENPKWTVEDVVARTTELTGISERTVFKIKREMADGKIWEPACKRKAKTEKRKLKNTYATDEELVLIRNVIKEFRARNEIPTCTEILRVVNDNPKLPNFSLKGMQRILKMLGYEQPEDSQNNTFNVRDEVIHTLHES